MAYLGLSLGIGTLSDAGRALPEKIHRPPEKFKEAILKRDRHTCRYCGFESQKYQEVNYTGGKPTQLASYATACIFCYQCFHLDRIDRMQSGALIWLPEIGQAALHHICRALYVARISQGVMADAAKDGLEALLARKEEARNRLGTDSPRILTSVLQDFLEAGEYKERHARLKGFRLLPLDRRIIREGDLEFNQFPQVLAYWRSKEGSFGDAPPKVWGKMLFELRDKIAKGDAEPVKTGEAGEGDAPIATAANPPPVEEANPAS